MCIFQVEVYWDMHVGYWLVARISEGIFNLGHTILKKMCEITFPQLFNRKGKVINFDPFFEHCTKWKYLLRFCYLYINQYRICNRVDFHIVFTLTISLRYVTVYKKSKFNKGTLTISKEAFTYDVRFLGR